MPIRRAMTNQRMAEPPKSNRLVRVRMTVAEVFKDRPRVSVREKSATWEKVRWGCLPKFSRMRSKTTMVSWTEKPITVNKAVTNKASTSTAKKWPKMEKRPKTTSKS